MIRSLLIAALIVCFVASLAIAAEPMSAVDSDMYFDININDAEIMKWFSTNLPSAIDTDMFFGVDETEITSW